jgi:ribosome-binding ATPase
MLPPPVNNPATETIRSNQRLDVGSEANSRAREALLRLEGKDYIVQDGDAMHIRHSGVRIL